MRAEVENTEQWRAILWSWDMIRTRRNFVTVPRDAIELAEHEAEEAWKEGRARGDLASIVRVVEAESGDVVSATTRQAKPHEESQ